MSVNGKLIVGLVAAAVGLVALSATVGVLVVRNKEPAAGTTGGTYDLGDVTMTFDGEAGHTVEFAGVAAPDTVLRGSLALHQAASPAETPCSDGEALCLQFPDATLTVSARSESPHAVECEDFRWDAEDCRTVQFEDCYDMRGAHWYGGTQIKAQRWPLEKWVRPSAPYVTGDSYQDEYGGVQERYWLSSAGVALYVQFEAPLWVGMNESGDGGLCLRAQYRDSPYEKHNAEREPLFLHYSVCRGAGLREVHQYMIDAYLGRPADIPDERMFRYPIWSTWAQYKQDIDQAKVAEFADNIQAAGFNIAQLEIDDDWEDEYGALDFNLEKFPDPAGMVSNLTARGIRTTLWVHPFVDLRSNFVWVGGLLFHYFKDPGGLLPALTTWWNGVATHVDLTAARTRAWFTSRLQHLRDEYGVHSFKFDAGESNLLPAATVPVTPFRINPSAVSTLYAELAYGADTAARSQEVRVAARTQHLPVFVRMMDKDSVWGWENGLATVIPHALTYSVLGYPYVLPDMIGGNAYQALPERELYIRWVQVNVFLPGFQFSIAPWDYDEEVVAICRAALALHEAYADTMIALAREATVTGAPIVRPLWWVAPRDEAALTEDSEFLLGDDLLVAPVLQPGARARDVYLPAGQWEDALRGGTLAGGRWYRDYRVELDELAYFTRATPENNDLHTGESTAERLV